MVSILIDEDFSLRSYQPDDAAALFAAIDSSRAHLRPWLNWVALTTKPEHTAGFIQQSIQQLHAQEGLSLGIFHKLQIIGGLGMHHWDHNIKTAQIGYWISPEFEGRGIVSKCTMRFIGFLFEKLDLNKVELRFVSANKRSASVAARLGAKVEGVLRESCLCNGRLEDLVVTGILKREWQVRESDSA